MSQFRKQDRLQHSSEPGGHFWWSHRIFPDLNLLLTRRPHQLTQSWCHRRTVCSHLVRPCCPSFLTIVFTRIHVWLRQEFRVNQAQACSHLGLCRRSSLCCQLLCHCIKLHCLQRYDFAQLLNLICCCHDSSPRYPYQSFLRSHAPVRQ